MIFAIWFNLDAFLFFVSLEEARLMQGFEVVMLRGHYPERLCSLTAKMCRRLYHEAGSKIQAVQVCCELFLMCLAQKMHIKH